MLNPEDDVVEGSSTVGIDRLEGEVRQDLVGMALEQFAAHDGDFGCVTIGGQGCAAIRGGG